MLEGKCSKCGYHCSGWALRLPRYQTCPKCGGGLDIYEEGYKAYTGYSPFTAEEYKIDLPNTTPITPDIEKDSLSKN
jgi:hypothetical protein